MSKIVYLNIPAHGHVNPTLPVAQELVQRGEQVIYYNTDEFRPQIERTGATFRPYPATVLSSAEISAALQGGNISNVSVLLLRAAEALLPYVLAELERTQPDLVVFDANVLWGRIAAARLNLPSVASITTFVFDLTAAKLSAREILRIMTQSLPQMPSILAARLRLTRRYGNVFPTNRPLFPVFGGLNIVFTSRQLQPDTPLIDQTFRFVGPSINTQSRQEHFPLELSQQQRLVYISLGTIHNSADFCRQCFAAFGAYPAQFVLSAGKDMDIEALGAIPANFTVRPSVPQLEVLQQADVFITHGGINSVHEGLYYGVPLILIPHQFEQLLNARVAATHGAGLVLEQQLTQGHVTAAELRPALETILAEPSYAAAAARISNILQAEGGYRKAADEIQALL